MVGRDEFWGRSQDLALLRDWDGSQSRLTVLYGRRRIGKTRLVEQAVPEGDLITVEGLEGLDKREQQALFRRMLVERFGDAGTVQTGADWLALLAKLSECLGPQPAVVLLDEFQWLACGKTELVSKLKHAWDNLFRKRNRIHLIVCGSVSSFMVKKVLRSRALYGRLGQEIRLCPLTMPEVVSHFTSKRSLREAVEIFLTVGGVPEYLWKFDLGQSVRMNLERHFFSPNAYFVNEFERLFASHFGANPHYRDILLYLSKSRGADRDALKRACRLESGGRSSEYLENLKLAGFVEEYPPVDKPRAERGTRFRLCDPYLDMYFRFVHPNRGEINARAGRNPLAQYLPDKQYCPWLGLAFERFCYDHRQLVADKLGFGAVAFHAGPWYSRRGDKHGGFQVDLVFVRADRVITLCEMKFQDRGVGAEVIAGAEQRRQRLCIPGQMTVEQVLVTASEPTPGLKKEGYFHRILTLEDLLM